MMKLTLADQFFRDQGRSGASGELSTILNRISLAGRMIANEVMKAPLLDNLGKTGSTNIQGEEVKALDMISNDIFEEVFERMEMVGGMASEELDEIQCFSTGLEGRYVVLHDPLDGSGNVDINGSMGTIFSVHRRMTAKGPVQLQDFLQQGTEQVAAGYILYGPSTLFVYATEGSDVNGFTLDRSVGVFFLTHPNMKFPEGKGSYACNEANQAKWSPEVSEMVRRFRAGETECGKRSARYVGALVADFHRTLIQGGIYMYPGQVDRPKGKLRLLYECSPLAFIAEAAGGIASDGEQRVLELDATELHQRCPLYIGSKPDVEEALRLLKGS